jgi:hypothetical protein
MSIPPNSNFRQMDNGYISPVLVHYFSPLLGNFKPDSPFILFRMLLRFGQKITVIDDNRYLGLGHKVCHGHINTFAISGER